MSTRRTSGRAFSARRAIASPPGVFSVSLSGSECSSLVSPTTADACSGGLCYIELMSQSGGHIDKPEPRWQVILAVLAVAGIYLALPRSLIVGPYWLLPVIIAVSLAPTIVAHEKAHHSLNHVL